MSKRTKGPEPIRDGDAAECGVASKKATKARASLQFDIRAALDAPIPVTQAGKARWISAFEAMFRRHVKKSLVEQSVPSMEFVIKQAEKHQVIKPPPAPQRGGVFVVPKGLPEEVEREIFAHRNDSAEPEPMSRIFGILRRFYNGR